MNKKMTKQLVVLAALTAGAASAQGFQLNLGGTFSGLGTGAHLGLTAQDLTTFAGYGVDGRVSADIRGSNSTLNVDALLAFPNDAFTIYAGPGLSFVTGGGTLRIALTGGVNFPLFNNIGAYAEGVLRINGASGLRAGVTYTF